VYTLAELQNHGFTNKDSNFVAIRGQLNIISAKAFFNVLFLGEVFDITQFAKIHSPAVINSRLAEHCLEVLITNVLL